MQIPIRSEGTVLAIERDIALTAITEGNCTHLKLSSAFRADESIATTIWTVHLAVSLRHMLANASAAVDESVADFVTIAQGQ